MQVSVIIPYFKDEKNISKSIASVLNQNYKNIEIIIIDDENSKNSKKILNKLKHKKIKILYTKKNLGVAKARNLGIKRSKGKFIAFLDSDDRWKKNKIYYQLKIIKKYNVDFCFTAYEAVKQNKIIYKVGVPQKIHYKELIYSNPICCSSTLIKSDIIKQNKFRNLLTKEDYELWLRLAKKNYFFLGINKILTIYQVRENTLSSKHFNKVKNAFVIYRKYNNFSYMKSLLLVFILYFSAFKKKYL